MNTTVTVTFTGLKNYFGIRDVTLIADNVTDIVNCYQQDNKTCLSCCCGFMLINKACNICPLYTYFNTLYCVTCPITCKTCELVPVSNVVVCTSCAFPLKLDSDT